MDATQFLLALVTAFLRNAERYLEVAGIAFLFFYVIFKRAAQSYKIQEKLPTLADYARDISYSVVTMIFFGIASVLTLIVLAPYSQMYLELSDMPVQYYGLSLVLMFFFHDFYFYWVHRAMHHKTIYRYVHKVHHFSTNPSPWTAYAFHPLEAILQASVVPLITFCIPAHRSAIIAFFVFQLLYNVYGHTGFEVLPKWFNKSLIGRWLTTSVAHNMHHRKFRGNYGLYTLIWDRLFGTLRADYDESYEQVVAKRRTRQPALEA